MSAVEFKEKFRHLLELRVKKDETDAAAKRAKKNYTEYLHELYDELEEAGIRGRHEFDFGEELGTAKFTRTSTTFGTVVNKDAALAALDAEGLADVIHERSVRQGRLNELVRDRIESGSELPEGVASYDKHNISVSRA